MDARAVRDEVQRIARRFAADRPERQRRHELDPGDFDDLAGAGFLLTGVGAPDGGLFESVRSSTRPISEILRTLARGDPSVALVCSMHPAVLAFWLATDAGDVPDRYHAAWVEQRASVAA